MSFGKVTSKNPNDYELMTSRMDGKQGYVFLCKGTVIGFTDFRLVYATAELLAIVEGVA